MRNTLLIVFTYKYPFEPPVEQFLDDEMKYLVKEDVDILLVPISRENNGKYYPLIQEEDKINVCRIKREGLKKETLKGVVFSAKHVSSIIKEMIRANKMVSKAYKTFALKEAFKQYVQGGALFDEIRTQIPDNVFDGKTNVILYSYWLSPTLLAAIFYKKLIRKQHNCNVSLYCRAHGDGDLYHAGMEKYRPCEQLINNDVDCIFPISEGGTNYLRNQGVDQVETRRLGVEKQTEVYVNNNEIPIIVSCSVINDNKRVQRIAEILSHVKSNVKWIHFGGGDLETELREYCKTNLPDNVSWELAGWTDHKKIMDYYGENRPDLFINVSKVEGIPVSIMEALSFSIPCVGTKTGAVNEIVEDGKSGFLLDVEFDTESAARIVENYITSAEETKSIMRVNAYNQFFDKYNAAVNYDEFSKRLVGNR